ncbi:hypothetical protein MPSEU_000454300 [Mayamaea pseudoterrestris]|nr:hypothetical protein MPSEU_000454300 [Mayamaea pseudoterrestris]
MAVVSSSKTFRIHLSALGVAGITVDRQLCRDVTQWSDSPPPPQEVRVVAVLSRNGDTLGVTPLSSLLRQSESKGSQKSHQRCLALWTESDIPPTITFKVDLQEVSKKEGRASYLAATSRLTSKDFELYLGVAWDDQAPVPIAAANLSLRAGMESKMYDLPLYPVAEVNLGIFQQTGRGVDEEKKDDFTRSAYGIDSLDALLRVQMTMEDACQVASPPHPARKCVVKTDRAREAPWPDPLDEVSHHRFGQGRRIELEEANIDQGGISEAENVATSNNADTGNLSKVVPVTVVIPNESFLTEDTDDSMDVNDEGSTAENTVETLDGTAASQDLLRALRAQVEHFLDSVPLPECRTIHRMVDRTFASEDGSKAKIRSSNTDPSTSHSDCFALSQVRDWLKSRDGEDQADHEEFWSIMSQRSAATGKEPGVQDLPEQVAKTEQATATSSQLAKEKLASESALISKPKRDGAFEDDTLEESLNSYSVEERSGMLEHSQRKVNNSALLTSHGSHQNDFSQANSVARLDKKRLSNGNNNVASGVSTNVLSGNDNVASGVSTNVLSGPGLTSPSTLAASADVSPRDVANFPGMLEGSFENMFKCKTAVNDHHSVRGHGGRPQIVHVKRFPEPEGDYSTVGDLTLDTNEQHDQCRSPFGSGLVLLRSRSKHIIPAPSTAISSFFAYGKPETNTEAAECPFDEEKAEPFMINDCNTAMPPDLSAAAGLAWAKQQAEQSNRRYSGRYVM